MSRSPGARRALCHCMHYALASARVSTVCCHSIVRPVPRAPSTETQILLGLYRFGDCLQLRCLSTSFCYCRFTLQRRMRVLTAPVPVASTPREVLDAANPDAVLAVLLHKIVASADREGAAEGHALLHDWLCQLATQYNVHVRGHNSATGAEVSTLAVFRSGHVAQAVSDQ